MTTAQGLEKNVNCRWCGAKVPRHAETIRVPEPGTNFAVYKRVPNDRAGLPAVSASMGAIDPEGYFCTMRCAVRFAVRMVEQGAKR